MLGIFGMEWAFLTLNACKPALQPLQLAFLGAVSKRKLE
jgi:hypothetical protein